MDERGVPMNCPACQHENPARAKFCLECGTALASRCASCGTELHLERNSASSVARG